MRKLSLIIAGIACAAIFGLFSTSFKSEAASETVLGGWSLVTDNTPAMMSDADRTRIDVALKDKGTNFDVIDLVATQVVSGTNYKALCIGNDQNLYVVTWYKDLQGNARLSSAECVNISAYSGR